MQAREDENFGLIKPVGLPPQMVVSFAVFPDIVDQFDRFYHNKFLPELFALSPQLRSIRRFVQYDTKSLPLTAAPHYFTFYELDSEETLEKTDAIFGNIHFAETLAMFRDYKEKSLIDFARLNYLPLHHIEPAVEGQGLARSAADGPCCAQLQMIELTSGREEAFLDWYLGQYQLQVFSELAGLLSGRTYRVEGNAPTRLLTVYESESEEALENFLQKLSFSRGNGTDGPWQSYLQDGTIAAYNSCAVRSVFCLPD